MTAPTMTSRDVGGALYRHFAQRYAVLTEIETAEHEATGGYPFPRTRRCDVLLLSKTERIAVEVKVSRADFRADVADPAKQAAWTRLTHRQAYCVPVGLVAVEEVPAGFGLLTVDERGQVTWARRAPKRPGHYPHDLPPQVHYALMHRLARAEAHAKGHGWGVEQRQDEGQLRARVARLERDLDVERNRTSRARQRADEWHRRFSASNPPPCETCARPLRPASTRSFSGWKHADADEQACHALRAAAEQARLDSLPDDDWQRRHLRVPEPTPADPLTMTEQAS